jgi:hypothetical protein
VNRRKTEAFLRDLLIELAVYCVLVGAYYLLVLKLLGDPLADLFQSSLVAYAVAGLALVVAQAVFLDMVTSFLVDRLGFGRSR